MGMRQRSKIAVLVALGVTPLLSLPAAANPSMDLMVGAMAASVLLVAVLLLEALIVLVEATSYACVLRVRWRDAARVSFVGNLVSFASGLAAGSAALLVQATFRWWMPYWAWLVLGFAVLCATELPLVAVLLRRWVSDRNLVLQVVFYTNVLTYTCSALLTHMVSAGAILRAVYGDSFPWK